MGFANFILVFPLNFIHVEACESVTDMFIFVLLGFICHLVEIYCMCHSWYYKRDGEFTGPFFLLNRKA